MALSVASVSWLFSWNVTFLQCDFHEIRETFLRTTAWAWTMENFTLQYSALETVGCHSNDMADPVRLPLQDHVLHGLTGRSTADLYHCVTLCHQWRQRIPCGQRMWKASRPLMWRLTVQDPGFTSIQQYSDTDSIVSCNFSRCWTVTVERHTGKDGWRQLRQVWYDDGHQLICRTQ